MRDANTGCASVGLAPMSRMTSADSTDLKSCVPAEVPNACDRPKPVGEWQTRAQVSTLLLPNAVRIIFCTANTSSFVHARRRDAADRVPAVTGLDVLQAASPRTQMASSHETTRPLVVDGLADHRVQLAVGVRGVAPREATLHARVTLVRAAVLVRHHAHDFLALHLGLERAADTAVRARGEHACAAAGPSR